MIFIHMFLEGHKHIFLFFLIAHFIQKDIQEFPEDVLFFVIQKTEKSEEVMLLVIKHPNMFILINKGSLHKSYLALWFFFAFSLTSCLGKTV